MKQPQVKKRKRAVIASQLVKYKQIRRIGRYEDSMKHYANVIRKSIERMEKC